MNSSATSGGPLTKDKLDTYQYQLYQESLARSAANLQMN